MSLITAAHRDVAHSELVVLEGAPHGCHVSDAEASHRVLIQFLEI